MSINPWLIVLGVLFLASTVWATVIHWNAIDPRVLGGARLREGAVKGAIWITLLIFMGAGGFGALFYFAFGKSERGAGIGASIVLLLGLFISARRVYLVYDQIDKRDKQVAAATTQPTPSPALQSLPAPSSLTPTNSPAPVNSPSTPPPAVPSNHATSTLPPAPSPAPPAAPAFDGKPVLDPLRAEFGGKCEAIAAKAEAAFAAAAKPRKLNQFLNDSITAFASLKADADALEAELRTLHTGGTREALERGGAPTSEVMGLVMDFDREFRTFDRQVACGEVSRFAEKAGELFTIIKDNFAKVQIDAKGQPTSKDRDVETKLFHARSQIGFAVSSKDKTLGNLRGK